MGIYNQQTVDLNVKHFLDGQKTLPAVYEGKLICREIDHGAEEEKMYMYRCPVCGDLFAVSGRADLDYTVCPNCTCGISLEPHP